MDLLERSHTTFVGPNSPYKVEPGGPLQDGIDRAMERMGYRIWIQRVQMPVAVYFEKNLKMTITFANDGVAPMYANWPAQLYLLDKTGNVRKTYPAEMDLRKILPGKAYTVEFLLPLNGLDAGTYRVGFGILDPLTGQPGVRLAMENPRKDLIQELCAFEVKAVSRLFGK